MQRFLRETHTRQPLLGPSAASPLRERQTLLGVCQPWETGQWLAQSQAQMLAWVTVPGTASPEDPRGAASPAAALCQALTMTQEAPCPALCQPHLAKTLVSWVLSLSEEELRPREVKSPT